MGRMGATNVLLEENAERRTPVDGAVSGSGV